MNGYISPTFFTYFTHLLLYKLVIYPGPKYINGNVKRNVSSLLYTLSAKIVELHRRREMFIVRQQRVKFFPKNFVIHTDAPMIPWSVILSKSVTMHGMLFSGVR